MKLILGSGGENGGALPSDNCRIGFFDYDDLATSTTPINIVGGAGPVKLTNDTLGPQTLKTFRPTNITDIWDASVSQFDFSQMKNGDMLDIRVALFLTTTSPNQQFNFDLNLAIGGFQYSIPFSSGQVKNVGTTLVSKFNGIYIGDDNTRLNPGEFVVSSDSNATVEVGGWYCKLLIRG